MFPVISVNNFLSRHCVLGNTPLHIPKIKRNWRRISGGHTFSEDNASERQFNEISA
jgi:hypothetical protein